MNAKVYEHEDVKVCKKQRAPSMQTFSDDGVKILKYA